MVLLERHWLTSGATWPAASLIGRLRYYAIDPLWVEKGDCAWGRELIPHVRQEPA